jgi:hypothetical protein
MANDAKAIDAREDPAQGEPTVEHEQTLSASSSSAQDELIDQHSEDTTHQSMGQATESMSSEGESVNTEEEKNPPKRMTNLVIAQDLRAFKEEVRGQINHLTERIDAIGNYLGMAATAHNGDDKVEDALPNDDDTHQFGAFGHEAYGTEHDTSYGYEEFEPEPATTYESDTKPYTEETPWSPTTSNGLLERLVACLCGEEVSSEPVEVLRARSGSCASLRVQTCLCPHGEVSYGCRAGTDTLEGLEITVIGHRLADTVRVDSDGIVEFNNLDNGQYLIRVDTPEGYSIGSVIVDDQPIDGPHDPHDFNIDEHTVGWWHLEQSDENTYPFASASFASNGGGDEQENVQDFETDHRQRRISNQHLLRRRSGGADGKGVLGRRWYARLARTITNPRCDGRCLPGATACRLHDDRRGWFVQHGRCPVRPGDDRASLGGQCSRSDVSPRLKRINRHASRSRQHRR